jgi:hypothetical protein
MPLLRVPSRHRIGKAACQSSAGAAGFVVQCLPKSDANRLDCYEALCDFEVEEAGEKGTGTAEYRIMPVFPQWKV